MLCISSNGKPILVFDKCCCFTLRTGVLIIAGLEILFSLSIMVLHLALTNVISSAPSHDPIEIVTVHPPGLVPPEEHPMPSYPPSGILDDTVRGVLHAVVFIVVSCLLIHGVRKNRIWLMKTWIWMRAVILLDDTIDQISITEKFVPFMATIFILVPISLFAILLVRSYVIKLTHNENFVQLEEVLEDV